MAFWNDSGINFNTEAIMLKSVYISNFLRLLWDVLPCCACLVVCQGRIAFNGYRATKLGRLIVGETGYKYLGQVQLRKQ